MRSFHGQLTVVTGKAEKAERLILGIAPAAPQGFQKLQLPSAYTHERRRPKPPRPYVLVQIDKG